MASIKIYNIDPTTWGVSINEGVSYLFQGSFTDCWHYLLAYESGSLG